MTPSAHVPVGTIVTVAGTGAAGFAGDGGPAVRAELNGPRIALDRAGNLYVSEVDNHRVRKVGTDGVIITLAGTGTSGFSGDGGPATAAQLAQPLGIEVDDAGNVYVAEWSNCRVRKVTPQGVITTVAGGGSGGDGGRAVDASLSYPFAVAVDTAGNVYVTERFGQRVRKITADGIIHTVAGSGTAGFSGDGGPATAARLNSPKGLGVDSAGNLYIGDQDNQRLRKVDTQGVITTIAGNGSPGYVRDGGPATDTRVNGAEGSVVDGDGNLYFADGGNHRIRKIRTDGTIVTLAGTGTGGYEGDGVPADTTTLYFPTTLALDDAGDLYVADGGNQRIRKIVGATRYDPAAPAVADLFGEVVSPHTVQRGQQFDLGARIKNRGPSTVDGQQVTVVLTLADGLVGGPGTTGPRLTRTFPGARLIPQYASLDGVFRVTAPETTPPGSYTSTLEIQYAGELNLKDNTFTLPVVVVAPAPVTDETALEIRQESVPRAAAGQAAKFNVVLDSPIGEPVNPGVIVQRFSAPTGFVFTGQPSYGYYNTIHGVIAGNLPYEIEDAGRTLLITANPHVNTTSSDTGPLVYTLGVRALADARPGVHHDGSAGVGKHAPVQLSAEVTGDSQDELALRLVQESVPEAKPGDPVSFNVEIRSLDDQPVNPGTIEQRFTAPTGFAFTGGTSYGYYYVRPAVTGNLQTQLEDGGRTLVITSNPHVNTGATDRTALLYTIGIRALPDATPGARPADGSAVIGRLAPVPLSAHVL
ncbi:serine/threonine-protein kinase PknD [Streptomyces chrestomyceticus JCM 4735]|uniref:Serine/threonine-protein kinase PknD n=1 Tax=Streptomyces chrestomyceticus JCM 4735 TaxID=1306181 RepID=A0A7U9Q4B1_9ACTN|nr:NHL repeat-containing protein [Streptomyces chrestomyceticus]GCD39279.1 serine/threonine-protein kinase PknD [Streptomyces chrestomyceticus JCM 4735]